MSIKEIVYDRLLQEYMETAMDILFWKDSQRTAFVLVLWLFLVVPNIHCIHRFVLIYLGLSLLLHGFNIILAEGRARRAKGEKGIDITISLYFRGAVSSFILKNWRSFFFLYLAFYVDFNVLTWGSFTEGGGINYYPDSKVHSPESDQSGKCSCNALVPYGKTPGSEDENTSISPLDQHQTFLEPWLLLEVLRCFDLFGIFSPLFDLLELTLNSAETVFSPSTYFPQTFPHHLSLTEIIARFLLKGLAAVCFQYVGARDAAAQKEDNALVSKSGNLNMDSVEISDHSMKQLRHSNRDLS